MTAALELARKVPPPPNDGKKYALVNGVWTVLVEATDGPITKAFTSAALAPAAGAQTLVPHGLGAMPVLVRACLRDVTGNSGFGLGTELHYPFMESYRGDSSSSGVLVTQDATNLILTMPSVVAFYYYATNGTVTGVTDLTDSWRLILRAWA